MALTSTFADAPAGTFSPPTAEVEYADEPGADDAAYEGPAVQSDEVRAPEPAESAEEPAPISASSESTETAEAEPSEPTEQVEFDPDFLKGVSDTYGLSEDDAKAFGTRENLNRAMSVIDRELSAIGRQLRGVAQPTHTQPAPSQESAAAQSSTTAAAPALSKFELKLDADAFDPDTLKALQAMNEHYHGQVEQLHSELLKERQQVASTHQQLETFTSQQQLAEAARVEQDMEAFFNGLGDEWKDTFGKGHYRELFAVNPTVVQNRAKLFEEMENIRAGEEARGRRASSLSELQQRALRAAFGDQLKTHARKEVAAKVQERQSQQIARPSGRNKAPASAEQVADANLQEKLRKARVTDDYGDEGL